jgi:PAP2 superfamily C-terminal
MSTISRLGVTLGLIVLWFASQKALSKRGFPTQGIHDKIHQWSSGLHAYICKNKSVSRWLLITSSLGIDILGLWVCFDSIFGHSFSPMIGLFILFSLRQLSQYLSALPAPEGMIWEYPGVPSIFVTYGVSNDLFFSGHTALAVYGGLHLLEYNHLAIQCLAVFLMIYEIFTVLILRAHWTMDVFAGLVTALWVHSITLKIGSLIENWIQSWL